MYRIKMYCYIYTRHTCIYIYILDIIHDRHDFYDVFNLIGIYVHMLCLRYITGNVLYALGNTYQLSYTIPIS